ncbi:MAG: SURF1 family protein [Rhizobiaceae bacterium]
MSRLSRMVLIASMLCLVAALLALGTWQMRRLEWKNNLVAEITERRTAAPRSVAEVNEIWKRDADVDYFPVSAHARFDHASEVYFYSTRDSAVGWEVITPAQLDDGTWLIVDRGFVPDSFRDPATRAQGQTEGMVEITGLARNPQSEKPNRFVPENRPEKREFYWKSFSQIAAATGLSGKTVIPFILDAEDRPIAGGWPKGGSTLISFPNNHLQYALTWYGLAVALVGVGGYFLFSRKTPAALNSQ